MDKVADKIGYLGDEYITFYWCFAELTDIYCGFRDVQFLPSCVGPEIESACADPKTGTTNYFTLMKMMSAQVVKM